MLTNLCGSLSRNLTPYSLLCHNADKRLSIFLTFDELKRLFNIIKAEGNKRDRALFLLAYRHGLRASEVGKLHKTDVDFKQLPLMCYRLKGSYSGQHTMEPDEV